MKKVKQAVTHVTSLFIFGSLTACAYISNAKNILTLPCSESTPPIIEDKATKKLMTASEYAELYGFATERHEAVTDDGFILILDRVISKDPLISKTKGPILLIHGLLQMSGVFVTSGVDSLAFVLANEGYDVWLGNNRCVELKHRNLKTSSSKFWDWSIDELARYDFPAMINFVLKTTDSTQLIYVGHSQGTSQAFLGLQFDPSISAKLKCFVALAPAMYIGPLLKQKPISFVVNTSDSTFIKLFGVKQFVPFMQTFKKYAPLALATNASYRFFFYVFSWTDDEWNKVHKRSYFKFSPSPTSAKTLLHWFQIARNGSVLKPFREKDMPVNTDETFDMSCIKCPLAVIYGEKDIIVDGDKLVAGCNGDVKVNLIHADCIPKYAHMDVLWGHNARELVFDKLIRKFEEL